MIRSNHVIRIFAENKYSFYDFHVQGATISVKITDIFLTIGFTLVATSIATAMSCVIFLTNEMLVAISYYRQGISPSPFMWYHYATVGNLFFCAAALTVQFFMVRRAAVKNPGA